MIDENCAEFRLPLETGQAAQILSNSYKSQSRLIEINADRPHAEARLAGAGSDYAINQSTDEAWRRSVAILSEHTRGDSSATDGWRGSCAFRSKNPALRGKLTFALQEHAMLVQVDTYVDEGGAEKLRRFRLDSRVVEVADNIDQWYGAGYRYVKVRGSDGNVYILRHNEIRAEWELTMYQHSQSQGAKVENIVFLRS